MPDIANEELSPILDDQPSSRDLLDFESYVQALKELIVHNKTRTPLTLGIFGRWGMGKTTLMKMLEKELNKDGITTIWFNAWQYSDEDELWAAFLQSILNKIQNSLGAFRLPVFRIKLFFRRIRWNEVPQSLIAYLFRLVVALLPILLIDPVSNQITPEAKPIIDLGGSLAAFVLSILLVGKPLFDSIQKNLSINISNFQKTSNYQEHIAFLDQFRDHFSDIVQSLPKREDKRLAVFIDDLDRCSPDRTIQVLDAIKLFVDVEGCVYVLGLDVDVVQKAVATKYKDDLIAQQEYMSKIIQLPFQLPPLTRDEMQEFLRQLSLDLPDANCQNVFITGLVVNPREVKRTINIFSLLWHLAAKRKELTGKINPVRLAKVVVIQQGYPELHKILLQRPYLLIELEYFFRREEVNKKDPILTGKVETEEKKTDLPPEMLMFAKNESLRSMLLLHNLPELADKAIADEYNFTHLKPEDVAVYFTLTSRAEAPKPDLTETRFSVKDIGLEGEPPKVDHPKKLGQYEIKYELGRGASAKVFLAYDQRLEMEVAIKVFSNSLTTDAASEKRFDREVRALATLTHPNIVKILNYGVQDGQPFYVMDYLSGGSLKAKLREKGTFSEKEIVHLSLPILDALSYINKKGFIHRDIKPSSILFTSGGEPCLADWGISHVIDKLMISTHTEENLIGTPFYMAPELWNEEKIYANSDLYSLGVVLFECVTGRLPFDATTPVGLLREHIGASTPSIRKFKADISIELEQIIQKLLAKDPKNRYQSASDVKTDIIRWWKG